MLASWAWNSRKAVAPRAPAASAANAVVVTGAIRAPGTTLTSRMLGKHKKSRRNESPSAPLVTKVRQQPSPRLQNHNPGAGSGAQVRRRTTEACEDRGCSPQSAQYVRNAKVVPASGREPDESHVPNIIETVHEMEDETARDGKVDAAHAKQEEKQSNIPPL